MTTLAAASSSCPRQTRPFSCSCPSQPLLAPTHPFQSLHHQPSGALLSEKAPETSSTLEPGTCQNWLDHFLSSESNVSHLSCRAAEAARRKRALSIIQLRAILLRLRATAHLTRSVSQNETLAYKVLSLALRASTAVAEARKRFPVPIPHPCSSCMRRNADQTIQIDSSVKYSHVAAMLATDVLTGRDMAWIFDETEQVPGSIRDSPVMDTMAAILLAKSPSATTIRTTHPTTTISCSTGLPSNKLHDCQHHTRHGMIGAKNSVFYLCCSNGTHIVGDETDHNSFVNGMRAPRSSHCNPVSGHPPKRCDETVEEPTSVERSDSDRKVTQLMYQRRTYYRAIAVDERRCPVAPWFSGTSVPVVGTKSREETNSFRYRFKETKSYIENTTTAKQKRSLLKLATEAHVGYGMFRVDSIRNRAPAEPVVRYIAEQFLKHGRTGDGIGLGKEIIESVVVNDADSTVPGPQSESTGISSAKSTAYFLENHQGPPRRTFFQASVEALQLVKLRDCIFEIGVDGRIRQQRKIKL